METTDQAIKHEPLTFQKLREIIYRWDYLLVITTSDEVFSVNCKAARIMEKRAVYKLYENSNVVFFMPISFMYCITRRKVGAYNFKG
jgi:hypothetical protein